MSVESTRVTMPAAKVVEVVSARVTTSVAKVVVVVSARVTTSVAKVVNNSGRATFQPALACRALLIETASVKSGFLCGFA